MPHNIPPPFFILKNFNEGWKTSVNPLCLHLDCGIDTLAPLFSRSVLTHFYFVSRLSRVVDLMLLASEYSACTFNMRTFSYLTKTFYILVIPSQIQPVFTLAQWSPSDRCSFYLFFLLNVDSREGLCIAFGLSCLVSLRHFQSSFPPLSFMTVTF